MIHKFSSVGQFFKLQPADYPVCLSQLAFFHHKPNAPAQGKEAQTREVAAFAGVCRFKQDLFRAVAVFQNVGNFRGSEIRGDIHIKPGLHVFQLRQGRFQIGLRLSQFVFLISDFRKVRAGDGRHVAGAPKVVNSQLAAFMVKLFRIP